MDQDILASQQSDKMDPTEQNTSTAQANPGVNTNFFFLKKQEGQDAPTGNILNIRFKKKTEDNIYFLNIRDKLNTKAK